MKRKFGKNIVVRQKAGEIKGQATHQIKKKKKKKLKKSIKIKPIKPILRMVNFNFLWLNMLSGDAKRIQSKASIPVEVLSAHNAES